MHCMQRKLGWKFFGYEGLDSLLASCLGRVCVWVEWLVPRMRHLIDRWTAIDTGSGVAPSSDEDAIIAMDHHGAAS